MKAILKIAVLYIVLGTTLSLSVKKELIENLLSCYNEHKVTEDERTDFGVGKITLANASENFKCSLKCFMDKFKLFDDTGKFKPEVYKSTYMSLGYSEDSGIGQAVETCQDKTGTSPCDTAIHIEFCIVDFLEAKKKADKMGSQN